VKTITKRDMVRNPSLIAHLKAGESVQVTGRDGDLVVSHPKKKRLSAPEIEAELDRLADQCPPLDCQAALNDFRS
jgi:hypothetical protein